MALYQVQHRLIIEDGRTLDGRIYNVTFQVTDGCTQMFEITSKPDFRDAFAEAGPIATNIVQRLSEVAGISTVVVSRYYIAVTKGTAFAWCDLQPAIIDVLGPHFNPQGEEVPILRRRKGGVLSPQNEAAEMSGVTQEDDEMEG